MWGAENPAIINIRYKSLNKRFMAFKMDKKGSVIKKN